MIEGTHAFPPKSQEEAAKMICLEGLIDATIQE